jgi:cytidylate kinase
MMEKGVSVDLDEIKQRIIERDHTDETRELSPLKKADDAIVLDNSNMSINEQMQWISGIIEKKLNES